MVKVNKKEDIFVRSSLPPDIRITFWSEEFFDLPYCVDCRQKIINDNVSYTFEMYSIPFKFLKILEEQNTAIKYIDIFEKLKNVENGKPIIKKNHIENPIFSLERHFDTKKTYTSYILKIIDKK